MAFRKYLSLVLPLLIFVLLRQPVTAAEAPPPPQGFSSSAALVAAIGAKKVKLIATVTNLPPGVVEQKDLEYGKVGDRSLKLDLYAPEKIEKAVPGLIFVHGGGWSGGNRDMYRYYTTRYAQKGYVCLTISYRFSQEAPFPAAVQDAKCAVRWLRANAAKYHVNPDKIGVIGASAGGHLAMMAGYSSDVPELEGEGGNSKVSSRVQAVVNFYGPVDLTTEFARDAGAVKAFLGKKPYAEAKELYRQASPLTYLTRDDPPTLIFHGTIDDVVPVSQADMLAKKLKELSIPCVYDRLEGWPHAMDIAEAVNERCRFFMTEFFNKYLPLPE